MPENGDASSGGHRRKKSMSLNPAFRISSPFSIPVPVEGPEPEFPDMRPLLGRDNTPSTSPSSSSSSSSIDVPHRRADSLLTTVNPFARRDEHTDQTILLYKITTLITYIILVVTTFVYTFHSPHEGHYHHSTIWGNNLHTPFAQNSIITSIYWLILFILQLVYAWSLYSSNTVYVSAAANIGSHYIASNLLLFGFIHLWVRSHFWLAELLIVINFFNLSFAYFRHSTTPRLIHIGTVSGPLAWNFVALYWVGAVAVHTNRLPARIVANIFIWGILAYGTFFLAAFKDYTMGIELSVLAFSTGVGQLLTKHPLQLQWIFAFVIGGLLFVLSLAVGIPGLLGKDPFKRGEIVSEDRERAPLLADE